MASEPATLGEGLIQEVSTPQSRFSTFSKRAIIAVFSAGAVAAVVALVAWNKAEDVDGDGTVSLNEMASCLWGCTTVGYDHDSQINRMGDVPDWSAYGGQSGRPNVGNPGRG